MEVRTAGEEIRVSREREHGWDAICAAKGRKTEKGRDILTGSSDFSTSIQNRQHSPLPGEGKEKETESHVKKGNQSCDSIMNGESKPTRNPILSLSCLISSVRPCAMATTSGRRTRSTLTPACGHFPWPPLKK